MNVTCIYVFIFPFRIEFDTVATVRHYKSNCFRKSMRSRFDSAIQAGIYLGNLDEIWTENSIFSLSFQTQSL